MLTSFRKIEEFYEKQQLNGGGSGDDASETMYHFVSGVFT